MLGGGGDDLLIGGQPCDGDLFVGGPGANDSASFARVRNDGIHVDAKIGGAVSDPDVGQLRRRPHRPRHREDRGLARAGRADRRRPATTPCSAAAAPTGSTAAAAGSAASAAAAATARRRCEYQRN